MLALGVGLKYDYYDSDDKNSASIIAIGSLVVVCVSFRFYGMLAEKRGLLKRVRILLFVRSDIVFRPIIYFLLVKQYKINLIMTVCLQCRYLKKIC